MEKICLTSRFVLILLLFCLEASNSAAIRSGFFYTRARGRCTPQYWSSRRETWPKMVPQKATVSSVFGSTAQERYRPDLTVLESTARNDDENAFGLLLKQASAALLNSYTRDGFGYSPWQVKTLVIQGMVSETEAARQANRFYTANQDCH